MQTLVLDDPDWSWDTLGRATPRVLAGAGVQAVVGFALAMAAYGLAPRAGLWVVLAVVLAALYPAAMVWPNTVAAPHAQAWLWIPFIVLLTLAAFDAIPDILHEAAAVDRAESWFKFRTITLPLAAPLLLLGVAFLIASGFRRVDARAVTAAYALLITAIVVGSGLARSRQ
ncbi:MAG: ABC transporter permease subunit [Planctomycetota bacterium]|nr:ABC transporter permease subunit [Planctomycetota bacterium]